jgi:hypothetical protein
MTALNKHFYVEKQGKKKKGPMDKFMNIGASSVHDPSYGSVPRRVLRSGRSSPEKPDIAPAGLPPPNLDLGSTHASEKLPEKK